MKKFKKPTELRMMRLRQGLTIRDLEKITGISKTTIIHREMNGFVPPKHIKKIADALCTDKEILFGLYMAAEADKMEKGEKE